MDIASKSIEELQELMKGYGQGGFRGKQLFEWLHQKMVRSYDEMTNLPLTLREQLARDFPIRSMKIVKKYESKLDGTIKYLFECEDSHIIESVLMRYKHGNSVCISSQVGCRMGCKFCASTLEGLVRNLTPSEMVSQIYLIEQDIKERVSNIVVMGSGEPLEHFELTKRFVELINSPQGQNIGQRHITVSTCGLVPRIKELAESLPQVTLAISLHAPTDEGRRRIMPIAYQYSIQELMDACAYYVEKTGRRITFEYALIYGENDSEEEARILGKLLKGLLCHVNLIPVNKIEERDYKESSVSHIQRFVKVLEEYHIPATVRRKLGSDIDAACGQLRRRYIKKRGE
ncbi:23S rRNA (adenine(2503)-C(2))-methyltransferase RlmN [Sporanaerobium hydrogeniformans]|uniref:23S rRNA (Adenine(2503)-C(2))-methyltransferase RlmN n=1 Tax=Sporanaerobium hydrogeniformans TaxID=3072179 RepID=A0AC61DES1_9FIRM|nr:23S rRNA (adenine(2503)-C(2))-methyltransferase RlmN [Sporanaerobium hydrogeniformans]PHV71804.1 23S rRNA (adenine(2503)-C(2))-methyltransferase RlmN [Sporanaerobium hydrogeniformans]